MSDTTETIAIRAERSLADSHTCNFVVDQTVHPGGPILYENAARATGSALPEQLFELGDVTAVVVADNVISVTKTPTSAWTDLAPRVGATIRAQLHTGIAPIRASTGAADGNRDDAALRAVIDELLEREVNRSIAAHGGRIDVIDVRDATLYIAMSGGCQGCAASQVTLREGFEVTVRKVAPEIVAIVDTTDHQAGTDPYYPDPPAGATSAGSSPLQAPDPTTHHPPEAPDRTPAATDNDQLRSPHDMTATNTTTPVMSLTDEARAKITQLLDQEADPALVLRVAVRPGGCSGFSYEMYFDTDVNPDDHTTDFDTVSVAVDPSSAELLQGAVLEYTDSLQGAGFHIDNPNAQRSCGCGQSFA